MSDPRKDAADRVLYGSHKIQPDNLSINTMRIRQAAEEARRRIGEMTGFCNPQPQVGEPQPAEPQLSRSDLQRLRELLTERRKRRYEALKVWQPMPGQKAFYDCPALEASVYGSNRSGKTTCVAVKLSDIVLNQHPLTGSVYPRKGVLAIVGFDEAHLGRVCYKKMFVEGAFKLINDPATGVPRPYVPDKDAALKSQVYPAPPLIPPRYIKKDGIAWNKKNKGIPSIIRLTTGWELWFFSSKAPPPQGFACDGMWFDEEIENDKWYSEAAARLVDNDGFFIWSATPLQGGDDLIDIHNRAEEQVEDPHALTREFFLSIDNNEFLSEKSKENFKAKYRDKPEEYRVRILGEFAAKAFKVYPEFNMAVHGFDPFQVWPGTGQPPTDWCRYIAVDPGRTVAAAAFLAVPPPEFHDQRWFVYDEIYIEKANATRMCEELERKTRHQSIEVILMDMHYGQQAHGGENDETIADIYRRILSAVGPDKINVWDRCRIKGFVPGVDKVDAGIMAVKEGLVIDGSRGYSRTTYAIGRLPNMETEFDKYQNKKVNGVLTDKPQQKWNHLMDGLRYLHCFKPTWQEPRSVPRVKTGALRRLEEKRARLADSAPPVVRFGPQSSMPTSNA
jgi:phage terminase large subunit-like protein